MTHPRRAIDYTPRRRRWPALAAAGVLLTSGGIGAVATLPAQADTPTPTPTPPEVVLAAEPGPSCGTVRLDITGSPLEVWRAVTESPTEGPDVDPHDWVRQARDPASRVDVIDPDGRAVTYRVLTWGGHTAHSDPVVTEACETPSPTPSAAASPSVSASATPDPTVSATAPGTPAPTGAAAESPAAGADKARSGGLASTGV